MLNCLYLSKNNAENYCKGLNKFLNLQGYKCDQKGFV